MCADWAGLGGLFMRIRLGPNDDWWGVVAFALSSSSELERDGGSSSC